MACRWASSPSVPPTLPRACCRSAERSSRCASTTSAISISSRRRCPKAHRDDRSEEHTSELQSLMRISYAVFCLKKKNTQHQKNTLKTHPLEHIQNSELKNQY